MTSPVRLLALLTLAVAVGAGEARPDRQAEHAAFAPTVAPKLLFFTIVGGAGDQWFNAVRVSGQRIDAAMEQGALGLTVMVKPDDAVTASVQGDKSAVGKPERDLPNGGKTGPYAWGYKQVDPNLQQPFLDGGGLSLWGWNIAQVKSAKVRYGPAMADSRIRGVWPTPRSTLLVAGSTDGGNTMLRADPRDRNVTLETGFDAGGGGGGRSTWLLDLDPRTGAPLGVLACRGQVVCFAYDAWNRLVVGGGAVNQPGTDMLGGYGDGAGILMTDYAWKTPLLRGHLGRRKDDKGDCGGMVWAIGIDSLSGLMAVAGWMEGTPSGVHPVQDKNGGGKDAFPAVIRLWTAEEAKAAKAAETAARTARN